jgi:hypothetical protein
MVQILQVTTHRICLPLSRSRDETPALPQPLLKTISCVIMRDKLSSHGLISSIDAFPVFADPQLSMQREGDSPSPSRIRARPEVPLTHAIEREMEKLDLVARDHTITRPYPLDTGSS